MADLVARAKRARLHRARPHVRLGIMRHLYLVLDASEAMFIQDLKPTRLMCCLKVRTETEGRPPRDAVGTGKFR